MFDIEGISNYIIFLIPIAILIGRFVRNARRKHEPPPEKPPQPYIPVHFEDDDDDVGREYFRKRNMEETPEAPKRAPKRKTEKTVAAAFTPKPDFLPSIIAKAAPPPKAPDRKDFTANLSHLSPLKQAVVMAEILGQPKGMM